MSFREKVFCLLKQFGKIRKLKNNSNNKNIEKYIDENSTEMLL